MKSSPPNRIRKVLVTMGVRVLADVGYAFTCCRRSTTAVLLGGRLKSSESRSGASPEVAISDSSADIYIREKFRSMLLEVPRNDAWRRASTPWLVSQMAGPDSWTRRSGILAAVADPLPSLAESRWNARAVEAGF